MIPFIWKSRIETSIETERLVVAQDWEWGWGRGVIAKRYGVSFWGLETSKILEFTVRIVAHICESTKIHISPKLKVAELQKDFFLD